MVAGSGLPTLGGVSTTDDHEGVDDPDPVRAAERTRDEAGRPPEVRMIRLHPYGGAYPVEEPEDRDDWHDLPRQWWDMASSAVRGLSPPTVPIAVPGDDDSVSQRQARAVIDVALRVGEAMLTTGASAGDVVTTVLRLTEAYGISSTHVDVSFTSITVSTHRGLDDDPVTVVRVVRQRVPDHTRLEQVQQLVDRVTRAEGDPPDIATVRDDLSSILKAPHPYRRWVVTLGNALIGAGVVQIMGGSLLTVLFSALSAGAVHEVSRRLKASGIAAFFVQVIGAAIPTSVAVLLYALDDLGYPVPWVEAPSQIAIAGIVVLLAGLTVVGAAQDAIDGNYVTASARGLEVLMQTVGIAIGISLVLSVATRFDVPIDMSAVVATVANFWIGVAAAAIIGVGYALSTYTAPKATLVSAVLAAFVWSVYDTLVGVGLDPSIMVAIASALAGAAGVVAHHRLHVPELAVTTAAILSMLPGLAVYRGLYLLIESSTFVGPGLGELITAAGIGIGIAAGVSAGAFSARHRLGLDRIAKKVELGRLRFDLGD